MFLRGSKITPARMVEVEKVKEIKVEGTVPTGSAPGKRVHFKSMSLPALFEEDETEEADLCDTLPLEIFDDFDDDDDGSPPSDSSSSSTTTGGDGDDDSGDSILSEGSDDDDQDLNFF